MLPDWSLTIIFYPLVVLILAALVAEAIGVRPAEPEQTPAEDDAAPR